MRPTSDGEDARDPGRQPPDAARARERHTCSIRFEPFLREPGIAGQPPASGRAGPIRSGRLEAARARETVAAVRLVIGPPAAHREADQLHADHQPDPRAEDPAAMCKLVPDARPPRSEFPAASDGRVRAPGRPAKAAPIFGSEFPARAPTGQARLTVGCSRDAGALKREPSQPPPSRSTGKSTSSHARRRRSLINGCAPAGLDSGSRIAPNGQDASHKRHCVQ